MTRKTIGTIVILSLFTFACAGVPGLGQPTPTALPQPTDLPTEAAAAAQTEASGEATASADVTEEASAEPTEVAAETEAAEPTDTPDLQDLSSDVVNTAKPVQQINLPGVGHIAIGPNSDQLAAAQGNSILIYDLPWPGSPTKLDGHTGKVNAVSWSVDGTQLVSGSDDGTVRIWDMATDKVVGNYTIDGSPVLTVAWSPDGSLIAAGTRKGIVELIDPTDGTVSLTIQVSKDGVPLGAITWSSDGTELGTALYQGSVNPGDIQLWDATSGDPLDSGKNAKSYTTPGPTGIAWSPTDEIVAWVSHAKNGQVALWSVGDDKNSVVYDAQSGVDSIAWGPNGDMIATAGADHTIQIWDPTDGTPLAKLTGSRDTITTVAWSPDETFLVTASADGSIIIWGSPSQ